MSIQRATNNRNTQNTMSDTLPRDGIFVSSLKRNNREIRSDRAQELAEDAMMSYTQLLQNLDIKIKRLRRRQRNATDLSPDSAFNLKPAKDFDAMGFVKSDSDLEAELANKMMRYRVVYRRFVELFGEAAETAGLPRPATIEEIFSMGPIGLEVEAEEPAAVAEPA